MKCYIGRGLEEYRDFDIIKNEILVLVCKYKEEIEKLTKNSRLIEVRKAFENNDKNAILIRKLIELLYEVKTIDDEKYIETIKRMEDK